MSDNELADIGAKAKRVLAEHTREMSEVVYDAYNRGYASGKSEDGYARNLIGTIKYNMHNPNISDADFRQFIINSLK